MGLIVTSNFLNLILLASSQVCVVCIGRLPGFCNPLRAASSQKTATVALFLSPSAEDNGI